MSYALKKFDHLIGLTGFSQKTLETHFALYEGYVKNTNLLLEQLEELRQNDKINSPLFAELKRRFGWEFNGMRLHEYYFGSLTKEPIEFNPSSGLGKKMTEDFGSYEKWLADFKATASQRGIGWAILTYDPIGHRLVNLWVNEHDAGHLAGTHLLLPLDVFEHAYILDYGTQRPQYIDAFLKSVNWTEIISKYKAVA